MVDRAAFRSAALVALLYIRPSVRASVETHGLLAIAMCRRHASVIVQIECNSRVYSFTPAEHEATGDVAVARARARRLGEPYFG